MKLKLIIIIYCLAATSLLAQSVSTSTLSVNGTTGKTQPPVSSLVMQGAAEFKITRGTGSPEGIVTAASGSLYLDLSGSLWSKHTGSGNTGWTEIGVGGGGVSDDVYGPAWAGYSATAGSKAATYNYLHQIDTDEDGKVNLIDQAAGITNTNSSGVVQPPITDNSVNWNSAFSERRQWDGSPTNLVASTGRTSLGLAIGTNIEAWDTQLDSLAALSYPGNGLKVIRVNAGETGFEPATVGSGTVTSITASAPIVLTPTPLVSTGTISISNFVGSGASHAKGAVPDPGATAGTTKFLREDATWVAPGSVTSVGFTAPAQFSVAGSPISGAGTLALSWANQTQKTFLAGPVSGANAAPTFRALQGTDLPALSINTIIDPG